MNTHFDRAAEKRISYLLNRCWLCQGSKELQVRGESGMYEWKNISTIISKPYTCGHCGNSLISEKAYYAVRSGSGVIHMRIYICHFCQRPTFFDELDNQFPGVLFGGAVKDIPDSTIEALYNEARRTTSAGAYTAAVLCCRKLLMHIAVSKGAQPGDTFTNYVKFFADEHFIPPDAIDWVDHIRDKGNEANHEIVIMNKETGEELIKFIEMLLKVIYEFPAAVKRKKAKP